MKTPYEITGKIHQLGEDEQVTDRFKKRVCVILDDTNEKYPQYIPIQFTQDNCSKLNGYRAGETVSAKFWVRGKETAKGIFVNLEGVEIAHYGK